MKLKTKYIQFQKQDIRQLNYKKQLTVDELLTLLLNKTNNLREKQIENALLSLKNNISCDIYLIQKYEEKFIQLFVKTWDESERIRAALWIFLKHWFNLIKNKSILSFNLNLILTCLQTSLTHQNFKIQIGSLFFLRLILKNFLTNINYKKLLEFLPILVEKLNQFLTIKKFSNKKENFKSVVILLELIKNILTSKNREMRKNFLDHVSILDVDIKKKNQTLTNSLLIKLIPILSATFYWLYKEQKWFTVKKMFILFNYCNLQYNILLKTSLLKKFKKKNI